MNIMKKEAGLDLTEIEAKNRIAYGVYTVLDNTLKMYAHWYCGGVGDRKEIIEHIKEIKHWGDALEKALLVYDENKRLEAKDPCYHCDHFKKQDSTLEQDVVNAQELTNELLKNSAK